MDELNTLDNAIATAHAAAVLQEGGHGSSEAVVLRDLSIRMRKLKRAWSRPQALGLFGPSQAGKSFLVGALLAHEMGSLMVKTKRADLDFLKEVNPNKGVESTGVVTRFTQRDDLHLKRGDFYCRLLPLEVVLESMATGFLVECTSPAVDVDRVERALRDARLQAGPPAPPLFAEAWDAVWHDLVKKYQDRHAYLNELRRHPTFVQGAWKKDIKTVGGWLLVFSLLWGGPGHAPDLDRLMGLLIAGLDALGYPEAVEAEIGHVRASSEASSIIDASCLNAVGQSRDIIRVFVHDSGREVAVDPGVLAALIAEIRLVLAPVPGSLLDRCDILDFPGGRALKGINGFGHAELSSGRLDNGIEVYKRGKLTFLFEQYALDREITALTLCSPGPTKPEAIQLQSQVESWLQIRFGSATPSTPNEVEQPSLFLALTKFDMSLGSLRSDNARDRWESRVQEACIDFWSRSASSWTNNWGARGRPFSNLFWIRNPYADQMQTLKPGTTDFEAVKAGYFEAQAVTRHFKNPEEKWAAVEGNDDTGLPRSGVPLLSAHMKQKLEVDVKRKELAEEARAIKSELLTVLRAMTPSRDEAEARARLLEDAKALVDAVDAEMARRCSGSVFGELVSLLVVPEADLEAEVRAACDLVAPMSIKASDKVKKVLVHVLKWWAARARARVRESESPLPVAQVEAFTREVLTSKMLLPVLGNAVFPYFSRTQVDAALLAQILHVKIADAMLDLFVVKPRRTPDGPVRLSYSEAAAAQGAAIDWADVSFEDDEDAPPPAMQIVFAGNRYYQHWKANVGEFFLKNGGQKLAAAPDDPRVTQLLRVLGEVERTHV
jgi:hypothetical protein